MNHIAMTFRYCLSWLDIDISAFIDEKCFCLCINCRYQGCYGKDKKLRSEKGIELMHVTECTAYKAKTIEYTDTLQPEDYIGGT